MRIAAQLYTIREHTTTRGGFLDSLRKLRDIGYREVQLSAVGCMNGEVSAAECRAMLDDLEMKAPLTHRPWEEIKDRTDECIQFHKTIGAELVALGSIPGEYKKEGLDGYRRFAEEAQPAIAKFKEAGLMFAYHNHAFEFERMGPGGETPFSMLVDGGLDFEIDTFWVVHAGIELVSLIKALKGRVPMVHLKDLAPVGNEIRMASVGSGNLHWSVILQALKDSGTVLCAVEQDDCYGRDPFECLAMSLSYLRSHGLG